MITVSSYQTIRPITTDMKPRIDALLRRYGRDASSHAFASLFLWQHHMGLSVCVEDELLAVRMGKRGDNAWFFPVGSEAACLAFLDAMSARPGFSLEYLTDADADFVQLHRPGLYRFREERRDSEYLYDREAQVALRGGKYKYLRAKVNRVKNRGAWTVRELDESTLPAALEAVRRWEAPDAGDAGVAEAGLENFEALGLRGILLEEGGEVRAVAYGSMLSEDTFDLHVTKTGRPSIGAYLRWELFSRLPEDVRIINMEEDLGLPGLRTNKTEACPIRLVSMWKGIPV